MSVAVHVLADDSVKFGSPTLAQHGVSLYVELNDLVFLMDTGWNGRVVVDNAKKMRLNLKKVDAIFLTHCHYDHTGGLLEVLREIGKDELPIFAHPSLFRNSLVKRGRRLKYVGVPKDVSPEKVEEAGGKLVLADRPTEFLEGVWSTGEVPRKTKFEDTGLNAFTKRGNRLVKDPMKDDMSVVLKLEDGIVVLTGCSHAGVVNIIWQAMKVTNDERVLGVMGGFHLISASKERIRRTVEEFERLRVKKVVAGHCTGFEAQRAFSNTFGKRFMPMATGLKVTFGGRR